MAFIKTIIEPPIQDNFNCIGAGLERRGRRNDTEACFQTTKERSRAFFCLSWLEIYANLQSPKTPKSISGKVPYRFVTHSVSKGSASRSEKDLAHKRQILSTSKSSVTLL
ncbi:hypothetical protein TNCV_1873501 [Trichonephila clavipes]|nr:hypothetical protein TNCV_1873501 [Trichonephila clavipes]